MAKIVLGIAHIAQRPNAQHPGQGPGRALSIATGGARTFLDKEGDPATYEEFAGPGPDPEGLYRN